MNIKSKIYVTIGFALASLFLIMGIGWYSISELENDINTVVLRQFLPLIDEEISPFISGEMMPLIVEDIPHIEKDEKCLQMLLRLDRDIHHVVIAEKMALGVSGELADEEMESIQKLHSENMIQAERYLFIFAGMLDDKKSKRLGDELLEAFLAWKERTKSVLIKANTPGKLHFAFKASNHGSAKRTFDELHRIISALSALKNEQVNDKLKKIESRKKNIRKQENLLEEKKDAVIVKAKSIEKSFSAMTFFFVGISVFISLFSATMAVLFSRTVTREINDRVRAQEELRKERDQAQRYLDIAGVMITALNERGEITLINRKGCSILGYEEYEILGRNWFDTCLPVDIRDGVKEVFLRLMSGNMELTEYYENPIITKTGETRIISFYNAILSDKSSKITGVLSSGEDITERKEAEEAMRKAKKEAESANRAKSEFLANMSHEIRTPMNGVVGMTELLLTTELSAQQKDYGEAISASANALLTVLNDILDFSKIQAGKLILESAPFNLRKVMEQVGQIFAQQIWSTGVELLVRYPPDVPTHVIGDPTRIRQVIANLVGNAVKFTEQGHVLSEVKCEKKSRDGCTLIFSVSDTGIGIPENRQVEIFDTFSQADETTTRKFGGTGLGLTISRQLVEMMGGRIQVESEPGKGSVFFFRLDFLRGEEVTESRGTGAGLSDVSVLVADDNDINRIIMLEYLRSWNISCEAVTSGAETLARLKEAKREGHPFDIAVLDYCMPLMNGDELAEAIKNDHEISGVMLILLSSAIQAEELKSQIYKKFAAVLMKPVRVSLFFQTLTEAWGKFKGEPSSVTGDHPEPKPAETLPCLNANVLLVEDNHMNQRVAAGIMRRYGCTVDIAENGGQAVERLSDRTYDMIFMDAHMPVMDGFEATAEIRKKEMQSSDSDREPLSRTPIIAMTALAMEGDRERCLEAGMDDYIPKPVKSKSVLEILLKYCPDSRQTEKPMHVAQDELLPDDGSKPAQVLDTSQLLDLSDHDEEMIQEFIDEFIKDAPVYLEELGESVISGDQNEIFKKAHRMRGLIANIGGEKMQKMVMGIEKQARKQNFQPADADLSMLKAELNNLKRALAKTNWTSLCNNK